MISFSLNRGRRGFQILLNKISIFEDDGSYSPVVTVRFTCNIQIKFITCIYRSMIKFVNHGMGFKMKYSIGTKFHIWGLLVTLTYRVIHIHSNKREVVFNSLPLDKNITLPGVLRK